MPTAGGDWQNFQNWLDSPQGGIFYLVLTIVISLIPVLVIFLHQYRKRALHSFPALSIWVGLGLMPAAGLIASYLGGSYAPPAPAFVLTSGVPLLAGIIILRWARGFERLPAVLIWLGLGLIPVMLALLISQWWNSFPSVGTMLTVVFAAPLFAGLIGLAIVRPRALEPTEDMST